jgi:hypothetical protein
MMRVGAEAISAAATFRVISADAGPPLLSQPKRFHARFHYRSSGSARRVMLPSEK